MTKSPPYSDAWSTSFSSAPTVAVTTMAGRVGGSGGWPYSYGSTLATTRARHLAIDVDHPVGDSERSHTAGWVGYVVVGQTLASGSASA